ncbi:hypothetical protein H2203_003723 [Taxawa tesnikishii (nom. ined.)]|nr:hypothetical protein H2203_003723 [Dothideales sp. JES 119]
MSKVVLVTGATGKQGGSVVDALQTNYPNQFTVLAVTRDVASSSAQKLASKPNVKLVQGNLDDEATSEPIWGVYSVQISMGKGVTYESEIAQGKALIDESVKNNVSQFVYSSVERGGDEASWDNETPIPHFSSKHKIEHHLRDNAGGMGWTILRPVAFMDNLAPGFPTKVFLTAVHNALGDNKSMQWIATADIGFFAAEAFAKPDEWNHKAVGLAGDELTFPEISKSFENSTGSLADVQKLRKINPQLMTLEDWIVKKSAFPTKQ